MLAALGVSTLPEPEAAGREAADLMRGRLPGGPPDLTLLLASTAHGARLADGVAAAGSRLGGRVVGASVEGVVASGVEISDYPVILALGIQAADGVPFLVHEAAGREPEVGDEIAARAGGLGPDDLVFLLADSQTVDVAALAGHVPDALGGAMLLGSGAAPVPRGRALLWCDDEKASDAVAGFALRRASPDLAIAQAGHPVTPLMPVTRARGHWVLGLGGRPALEVYEETARACGLGPDAPSALLAGLAIPGLEGGELLVRNVVGIDRDRGAFSLPEPMASGQALALVQLDAETARADLAERFAALSSREASREASRQAAFGLYLNCRARGAALFGEPGVEATEIANAFAGFPIAGISGAFQLAPPAPGARPALLAYAGALCLVGDSR